jgi:hypothetical protein
VLNLNFDEPKQLELEHIMSRNLEPKSADNLSLGEFVTLLILQLDRQEVSMPFQNEEKWHRLFYMLKAGGSAPGRPKFFEKLRFDWDGRFPRSEDLSEYLQALHWNGFISVANPSYDRLSVDEDVRKSIDKVSPRIDDKNLEKFVEGTVVKAIDSFKS